ncbi:MAG: GTP cyclohydrolase II [Acetobacteraceae bacterium]|nr:GTP cyclohydrolase II [Acetobacteraceae bacterium]
MIASAARPQDRNVIGTYGGAYALYRALAVSSGLLSPLARPDLTNTHPVVEIGPYPQWSEPGKIVSLDPWGHLVADVFAEAIAEGIDVRPTIAITRARLNLPEINAELARGSLTADGTVLHPNGDISVVKAAIDPVWWLPGIAARFGVAEHVLRRTLFEQTGGMYPELVTRPDLEVFLPPIGGTTLYIFGDARALADPSRPLTCRVHDECNGSDVFGSDICTCRPYLLHGIEECVRAAQAGGVGLIVYNRKEGRALGEVTKFLVYNARKRQEGGDRADTYFERTECVAGVQDARFQQLMPDVLHWLGVTRDPSLRVDVEHEVRGPRRPRDRGAGAGADPARAHSGRRGGGDRGEEGSRVLRAATALGGGASPHLGPPAGADVSDAALLDASALLTPEAVRERAQAMLALARADRTLAWRLDETRLETVADRVAAVTRATFPDLAVPLHARWRHFVVGGRDLWAEAAAASGLAGAERRARGLRYGRSSRSCSMPALGRLGAIAPRTERSCARSEGLAVASLELLAQRRVLVAPAAAGGGR